MSLGDTHLNTTAYYIGRPLTWVAITITLHEVQCANLQAYDHKGEHEICTVVIDGAYELQYETFSSDRNISSRVLTSRP